MTSKTTEQAAEETIQIAIPPTTLNVGLSIEYNTSLSDFVLEQGDGGIVLDLSQALMVSDFILNLNRNQQIIADLQATLSEYKQKAEALEVENERLSALVPVWINVAMNVPQINTEILIYHVNGHIDAWFYEGEQDLKYFTHWQTFPGRPINHRSVKR